MARVIAKAKKAAARNVTVLIEGESGTGKELLALAIRNSGPRKDRPLRVVNCGAIPSELLESELFGHVKGAYTGAFRDRKGYFEQAHGGTLFLDEIGELPASAQVKLLRVLQEGSVTRVGESEPRKVDVRIIAATNRILVQEVRAGRFREDLYYRLAQVVLNVPPLRERQGDVSLLISRLLEQVIRDHEGEPGIQPKQLSSAAKRLLIGQQWHGNVRELQSTLRRAVIWSDSEIISEMDIADALLPDLRRPSDAGSLLPPLGEGVAVEEIIEAVRDHYVTRALDETGGNKAAAARLLGLKHAQTLSNWVTKSSTPPSKTKHRRSAGR